MLAAVQEENGLLRAISGMAPTPIASDEKISTEQVRQVD